MEDCLWRLKSKMQRLKVYNIQTPRPGCGLDCIHDDRIHDDCTHMSSIKDCIHDDRIHDDCTCMSSIKVPRSNNECM